MVVSERPCASAASTRQDATRRSLRITEQAPQSPVPQPSLRAGQAQAVADRTQQRFVGRTEELGGLAVHDGFNVQFGHVHRSFARGQQRPGRPAWSGRRRPAAGTPRCPACRQWVGRQRWQRQPPASRRRRRGANRRAPRPASGTSSAVGATAPMATRAADTYAVGVERQAHRRGRDRNVHLRAWNQPLVGVAGVRRRLRQAHRHEQFIAAEHRPAGSHRELLHGHLRARPVGPAMTARRGPRSASRPNRPPARRCTGCRRSNFAPGSGSTRSGARRPRAPATRL